MAAEKISETKDYNVVLKRHCIQSPRNFSSYTVHKQTIIWTSAKVLRTGNCFIDREKREHCVSSLTRFCGPAKSAVFYSARAIFRIQRYSIWSGCKRRRGTYESGETLLPRATSLWTVCMLFCWSYRVAFILGRQCTCSWMFTLTASSLMFCLWRHFNTTSALDFVTSEMARLIDVTKLFC